jgi:autonomous glycyl radical cofactor GrcA
MYSTSHKPWTIYQDQQCYNIYVWYRSTNVKFDGGNSLNVFVIRKNNFDDVIYHVIAKY